MIQPKYFSMAENTICCSLCPRKCSIPQGGCGKCLVRLNSSGKPEIPYNGFISSIGIDPIEKKPLYHFRPGTQILSVGFTGCNLHCPFCQNWRISQRADVPGRKMHPKELVREAEKTAEPISVEQASIEGKQVSGSALAYTYSEPLIHIEYLLECMKKAKEAGVANVLVSNGCINIEAASEVLDLCDAANIDLKCFKDETYKNVLGGDLSCVIGFIHTALEKNVHLELTTLIVPGLNDSKEELESITDFILDLQKVDRKIPWHLSAYHPSYKWNVKATDPSFIVAAAEHAREKLEYVYTGNIAADKNTHCSFCKKNLVNRQSFMVDAKGLSLKEDNGKYFYHCAYCGERVPIRFS